MCFSLRNILTCFALLSFFICCASPVSALEIEWGAQNVRTDAADASVIAPEIEATDAASDLESGGLEKGFRGVSWGKTKEQMEDELHMEFVQCLELPGERLNCALEGANKSIRDIPLILLRYKFIGEVFLRHLL